MRYMPTCSLGSKKPRSWFRPDIWPHVSNPTWVEAGLLQLPLQLSHGLVVIPGWSTPSWSLPSLRQKHREELCGFSQEDSLELYKPGVIAVCSKILLGTSVTHMWWLGEEVVAIPLWIASVGSQGATNSCHVCSICEDELWKSGLLVFSLQFSIFLYLLFSSTDLLLTPWRAAKGDSCGGDQQGTIWNARGQVF